jgi:hypothetical protein
MAVVCGFMPVQRRVALRGMTLPSDRDLSKQPKRKTAEATRKGGRGGGGGGDGNKDMGAALRSVYDKTLKESIPDEMLDLLGKLG